MALSKNAIKECYVDLDLGAGLFNRVLVYLPRRQQRDGSMTSYQGEFKTFTMRQVICETKLDDFHLECNVYYNDYGTAVKPIEVTLNNVEYHQAYLFCRVRKLASRHHVTNIERYLNAYLGKYKDNLRDGIAQEWCAQEQYRIFPASNEHCLQPAELDATGRATLYKVPNLDMRSVLREMLPKGWDDEAPV